jgi:cell division protein FtsL
MQVQVLPRSQNLKKIMKPETISLIIIVAVITLLLLISSFYLEHKMNQLFLQMREIEEKIKAAEKEKQREIIVKFLHPTTKYELERGGFHVRRGLNVWKISW